MAVELRDPVSGRYTLYTSQAAHSADCALYPYESLPRRVFLDTSVVNVIVKFREEIFEGRPIDSVMEPVLAEDVESLSHLFAAGTRTPWNLVSSRTMLQELSQTRSDEVREELLDYGINLVDPAIDGEHWFRDDLARKLEGSSLLAALPDKADRRLLSHAIAMECDVFCTRDRSTIVSKRSRLPRMAVRIVTPREWWAHFKPWLGLFL